MANVTKKHLVTEEEIKFIKKQCGVATDATIGLFLAMKKQLAECQNQVDMIYESELGCEQDEVEEEDEGIDTYRVSELLDDIEYKLDEIRKLIK